MKASVWLLLLPQKLSLWSVDTCVSMFLPPPPTLLPPSFWKASSGEHIKFSNPNINCIIVKQASENNQPLKHSSLSSFAPAISHFITGWECASEHRWDNNTNFIYDYVLKKSNTRCWGEKYKSCCIIVQNSIYSPALLCGVLPAHLFPPLSSEPAIWGVSYCGRNENVQV